MENNAVWKYCPVTTKNHHISQKHTSCMTMINELCVKEGANKTPFNDECCFNIDRVEEIIAHKEKRVKHSTIDFFIGVKFDNNFGVLLCELKLNVKNVKNFSREDIDNKIKYSINIIGHEPKIIKPYLFIFQSNIRNEATNRLRRLFTNKPNFIQVNDLSQFKENYF